VTPSAPSAESVAASVEPVRKRLLSHAGDFEIARVSPEGVAEVGFLGACRGCPALAFTFSAVVAPAVREVEGVTDVVSPDVKASPFVMARIEALRQRHQTAVDQGRAHAA